MDERLRFVVDCLAGEETMSEICAAYGISRKIGYKWLGRYRALGRKVCAICHGRRSITAGRRLWIWWNG
ncbi:helix-turn-helix domain-containing protein, partial [Mesorhizobium sp. B283B1A]|nr:helix-turn-helix domain-containing protein [Mesorhizobium sp. B283B1A]